MKTNEPAFLVGCDVGERMTVADISARLGERTMCVVSAGDGRWCATVSASDARPGGLQATRVIGETLGAAIASALGMTL